ncbi:MAG: AAA family ATPase [Bacilli bacterium]|mgnify:FL=1|jgi:guanylate kinase|nr:AAA family ATPase [Bacilli bacterium]HPM07636.1 AAA family ATPase [Bacilli bacterium]HPV69577.1 AAA family ATPase [Bacilli bacterium]HPY38489.1 AAA family ATPase [Bacilli bacterium]HQC32902.1 AAA family ATPase [Bacilli bacterium]
MIILVGASASGKTEIAKILARKYGIAKAITHTTRPMRDGEKDGLDYFFVSKEDFQKLLAENFFVEMTLYNENYYGCSKSQVSDNRAVIVDPNGLKAFQKLNDASVISFLVVADEEVRYQRMLTRGDKKENAIKRINNDRVDFSSENVGNTNYVIVNQENSLEEAADSIYQKYIAALKRIKN